MDKHRIKYTKRSGHVLRWYSNISKSNKQIEEETQTLTYIHTHTIKLLKLYTHTMIKINTLTHTNTGTNVTHGGTHEIFDESRLASVVASDRKFDQDLIVDKGDNMVPRSG